MIYFLLFLSGLTLLLVAGIQFTRARNLLSTGTRTTAKVVDILVESDSDGKAYRPVFEFFTSSQEPRHFKHELASNPVYWKVGEETSIIYNPGDPNQVRLIGYWGLFRWTIILLSIALPMLVVGGGYFLYLFSIDAILRNK